MNIHEQWICLTLFQFININKQYFRAKALKQNLPESPGIQLIKNEGTKDK